jgi:hypothetical protein
MAERLAMAPVLLAGIGAKVSPRVVPLWSDYIFGGSAPQDLSSKFAADFTNSATTVGVTDFLADALKTDLERNPPTFPAGSKTVVVDLPSRIGSAIAELGNPGSPNVMDFSVIGEIPGNIAGGVGKNQSACKIGAQPSPFDDDRTATGSAEVTRNPDGSLTAVTKIAFKVTDTIDLCPGNCGASIEQVATIPMSRWEATGISGDVPFTVEFPAPPRAVTTSPPPAPAPPAPAPVVPPAAAAAVTGEVTASFLQIRAAPRTSAPVLGMYPRGTIITILCEVAGTNVEGNSTWDKTDRGFVSDRYVSRMGPDAPPGC